VCGVTAAGVDSWVEDSDLVRGLLLVEDVFEVRVLWRSLHEHEWLCVGTGYDSFLSGNVFCSLG